MTSGLHTIKATSGAHRRRKRVGRGNASQKGTYAARGLKGQRARSGGKGGTKKLGFKSSLQKVPKLRGFRSIHPKKEVVTLATLDRITKDGTLVNPSFLKKVGVIDKPVNGVKILATGNLTKKITLKGCVASKKAVEVIEKAGGTIEF